MKRLVLASTSPYRARLLERLGIPFTTCAPDIDETPHPGETAATLASRLAIAKARAGAALQPDRHALIIGSDQVASCRGRLLGKPGTSDQARQQLTWCAGATVRFETGIALFDNEAQTLLQHTEPFDVHMRALSEEEIAAYVERDQPLDCAGSFRWESLGIALFQRLSGDDPTALEGLPLIALCALLRDSGIEVL
jgi:septum formation protein